MTTDLDFIISEKIRLWDVHPIITESAILPTRAVQNALSHVLDISRKARASIALVAAPLSGKTYCIRMIKIKALKDIPGCGVLMLEAVEDTQPAEGRLLTQILKTLGYTHKIESALAGKREQVRRALIALAGSAKHLFILLDEAQEFCNKEFAWLKAVINSLAKAGIKVTTVLFGQTELTKRRDELFREGRSDLGVRFMKQLIEFKRCGTLEDIKTILAAVDEKSEFPLRSKWTYTQLLFPRAFANGFRLSKIADNLWALFGKVIPPQLLAEGLSMEFIAATLAQICIVSKKLDSADFKLTDELLEKAISKALG
jgi:hypothetical protein